MAETKVKLTVETDGDLHKYDWGAHPDYNPEGPGQPDMSESKPDGETQVILKRER